MLQWSRRNPRVILGYFPSVFGIIESAAKKGYRIDFPEEEQCRRSDKRVMEKGRHRSEFEEASPRQSHRFAKRPRQSFAVEAVKVENFPFVVLLLVATISLISRLWLMVG